MSNLSKVISRLLIVVFSVVFLMPPLSTPVAAQVPTIKYTAMGDSLGFGIGASAGNAYVPRYQNFIQTDTGRNVSLVNFSVPGWTSTDLLNALRNNQTLRNSVATSQVVTWDIGGNDLNNAFARFQNRTCGGADNQNCLRSAVTTFKSNWNGIITQVLTLRSTGTTVIRTMDIYNPFVNRLRDAGIFGLVKPYLDDVNNHIATTSTESNIPYARAYVAFNGNDGSEDPGDKGYLSGDQFHPNDVGYGVIADLFRGLGYSPLVNPPTTNQVDEIQFFVRQHYRDFLDREADAAGLAFWVNQLEACGADVACQEARRINVSAAFFLSIEFQQTGFLVHKTHQAAFARPNVPLTLAEFLRDTNIIRQGFIVGQGNWEQQLETNKQAFFNGFVLRPEFVSRYPESTPGGPYIDTLYANAGIVPTQAERDAAFSAFGNGGAAGRARALRVVAENGSVSARQFNPAFVLMQYFGYLRREPNASPDTDFSGFNFWLAKLNQFNGDFVQAEMVKAFLTSEEYRKRFGVS